MTATLLDIEPTADESVITIAEDDVIVTGDLDGYVSADDAAEANSRFVSAQMTATQSAAEAESAFETSARAFAAAVFGAGIKATVLARTVKAAQDRMAEELSEQGLSKAQIKERMAGLFYSANSSVGFHARTGVWLGLEEDAADSKHSMPEDKGPRDVQAVIKQVPTATVDEILHAEGMTRGKAFKALVKAAKEAKEEKGEKAAAANGVQVESSATIKDALHYLRAMSGTVDKVTGLGVEMWTDEAVSTAAALASTLNNLAAKIGEALAGQDSDNDGTTLTLLSA